MKNKVVKYWPIQPSNGNLQYWDGEQWVTLPNGLIEQYLMTHSTIIGPTWEYLELSSSSSSSSSSDSLFFGEPSVKNSVTWTLSSL